ncbi:MAG: hypothetical protein QOF83_1474 [Solirubrobacteraceae bacterium]|nr:hypothetical protein [Solirubrobacteraceae bacterium]
MHPSSRTYEQTAVRRTSARRLGTTIHWPPGRETLALVIGVGAALSATDPLNTVNARLDLLGRPWLAPLSPAVIIAVLAVLAGVMFRRHDRPSLPRGIAVGAALVLLAGVVSTAASAQPGRSTVLLITCLLAPGLTLAGVWWSDIPRRLLAASWLLGIGLLLVRADIAFALKDGFPTPQTLFTAKYSNAPYDFHYYTLGNPNSTTAFLVMPLTFALLWSRGRELDSWARRSLAAVTVFLAINMTMVFTRTGIAIVVILAVFALLASPWRRRWQTWLVVAVLAGVGLWNPTLRHYFSDVAQQGQGSSGQVRVSSIKNGLDALIARPITGFGLGQHGVDVGFNPAHSAVAQAGAETGGAGALGVAIIMISVCLMAIQVGRRDRWRGLRAAGAASAAMFAVLSAAAGSTGEWLGSDATSAWGLALAVSLTSLSAAPRTEAWTPKVRAAIESARRSAPRLPRISPALTSWPIGRWILLDWVLKGTAAAVVLGVAAVVALSPNLNSRLYARFPQYGPVLQRLPLRAPGPLYDATVDGAAIHRAAQLIGSQSTYFIYESPHVSAGLSTSLRAAGLLFFGSALPVNNPSAAEWILSYQAAHVAPPAVTVRRRYRVGPGVYVLKVAPS